MNEALAQRLQQAIKAKGVNQAELAEAIKTSAAAVSAWCTGKKRPSRDNLQVIADFLGTSAAWLEYGDDAAGPAASDLEPARQEYKEKLGWYFQKPPPDSQRILGNPAEYAFRGDFETLGRETGQNSLDERRPGEAGIHMSYSVIELEGPDLEEFLKAIRWHELKPHIEAAASSSQKTAAVIRSGLKHLETKKRLVLLRVEDHNANGLIGPEYDTGQFMAVARNVLDSQKSATTAGGSYGLGKSAMWAVSSFGLVLMNSTLSVAERGTTDNRFFGRLELPWREIDGQSFAGPGWFGEWDEDRERKCTRSYFGNPALAYDTHLVREGASGTTFLIVGAYDPSGEAEDAEEIAQALRRSLAENFWPAMVPTSPGGKPLLRVQVRTQRGRNVTSDYEVDPADFVPELVDLLRKHYDDVVVEDVESPGDVVRQLMPLSVPPRLENPDHDRVDHEAVLLVGQAVDLESPWVDTVSFLRGNRMVVWHELLRPLPLGSRPFHAVVLCGEAAGDTEQDLHAERFLRAAEPPAHHRWEATPDVTSRYARGGRKALDDFRRAVRDAIRDVVSSTTKQLSDGPGALKELLRIVPPITETHTKPRVKQVIGQPNESDAWQVEVTVSVPPKGKGWQFVPILKFATESGPSIGVKWQIVEGLTNCSVADPKKWILGIAPGARTATFKGVTDPSSHPVSARRSKAVVDLREVHGEDGH